MKRPAFQFYPADWRKDSALQSCSLTARGLWAEMMCVMHECQPYGHLAINGKAMTVAQLARLVGETERQVAALLKELEGAGVFSRTDEGVIYSRRMVKDERIREVRAKSGRLGGNPNLLNQKDNHPPNLPPNHEGEQKPTPSSSSSSSIQIPSESAASPPRPDFKAQVWSLGVVTLTDQGIPESTARKFLGSLLAEWSEETVAGAVKAAIGKADAKAYIVGVLKQKPKAHETGLRLAI